MAVLDRWLVSRAVAGPALAELVGMDRRGRAAVAVQPPKTGDVPATVDGLIDRLFAPSSRWFGVVNTSPILSFEIIRRRDRGVRLRFTVPSQWLMRAVRTQLPVDVDGVEFAEGATTLPVDADDVVGGGVLRPGIEDWYPFKTEFDEPPTNSIVAALHRHSMQDTDVVIQLMFQPSVVGRPVRRWWWRRSGYQRIGYLRKEKHAVVPWHDRPATPRERRQADAIEEKIGANRFHVCIRFLVIGSELVESRVREVASAFNVFENEETGQYFDTVTVSSWTERHIRRFVQRVWQRRFDGTPQFQISTHELAGLVAVPSLDHPDLQSTQS